MIRFLIVHFIILQWFASQNAFSSEASDSNTNSRQDFFEISSDQIQGLSSGVALVLDRRVAEKRLELNQAISNPTLQSRYRVCPGTAYSQQPSLGYCTAFLVDSDLVLTAGHCVKTSTQCSQTAFLFGYSKFADDAPIFPNRQSIFYCSRILQLEINRLTGIDFAVIRLNRKANNRKVLKFDSSKVELNQRVYTLGHPTGLPLKLSSGKALAIGQNPIPAHLNAFIGSSGSPVFSNDSHMVVGLLTKGDKDFEFDSERHCYKLKECKNARCRSDYFYPVLKLPFHN